MLPLTKHQKKKTQQHSATTTMTYAPSLDFATSSTPQIKHSQQYITKLKYYGEILHTPSYDDIHNLYICITKFLIVS